MEEGWRSFLVCVLLFFVVAIVGVAFIETPQISFEVSLAIALGATALVISLMIFTGTPLGKVFISLLGSATGLFSGALIYGFLSGKIVIGLIFGLQSAAATFLFGTVAIIAIRFLIGRDREGAFLTNKKPP